MKTAENESRSHELVINLMHGRLLFLGIRRHLLLWLLLDCGCANSNEMTDYRNRVTIYASTTYVPFLKESDVSFLFSIFISFLLTNSDTCEFLPCQDF